MATNTQIVAALSWTDSPPDLSCIPGDLNALGQLLAQFLTVTSVTSEVDQQSTNSIAQQALETANIALASAQSAQNSIPQIRSSGEPIAISTGDSKFSIAWTPAMPDTNYEVRVTYYGADVAVAAYYACRVVDGSRTVNGCTLRLDNTPANTKIAWVVQQLPSQ